MAKMKMSRVSGEKMTSWTISGCSDNIIAYSRFAKEKGELAVTDALEKKVYDAEDIQRLLGIGRSKVYTFLEEVYQKQEPFRVIKIGKLFRVPKQSFDDWLNGNI